ncbi:MAG: glycosyltransferase [SAR202 cluster bacterium]|nr:glycosyltransferase [SAR202 cluster bacterium]
MIAAIAYATFGPFHSARLEAAGVLGKARGHTLVGIQIASGQTDYQWPAASSYGKDYQLRTLFPGQEYWKLESGEIKKALCQALNEINPQVVVLPGWGFKESVAGLGWCLRNGVARVVISDSQAIDNPRRPGRQWVKSFLVKRFQAALAGGQPHIRYLARLGLPARRCYVGCDVVDNAFFARITNPVEQENIPPREPPVLLSCLRLLPRKNVLGVLEALAGHPHWDWIIAGDGPHRAKIESEIAELGLKKRVRLLGHVDYMQLPEIYAQADVYLQPSLSEPWGLAVNEAMASGLPVVVSNRCGCHEDLVKEGVNGFTFDPRKPSTLSKVLDQLPACREQWPEMGQASRDIIREWGLDLFAQNLWRACDTAIHQQSERPDRRLATRALSRLI